MNRMANKTSQKPIVVKYCQNEPSGIQLQKQGRHSIGYVLKGKKYIYNGDERDEVDTDDIFYMGIGSHYVEYIPAEGGNFEQITLYYSMEQLSRIVRQLSLEFNFNVSNGHECERCKDSNHVVCPAEPMIKTFFTNLNKYIKQGLLERDEVGENLMIAELIYLVISDSDCCIKNKILSNLDFSAKNFEHIIRSNIFNDISLEELAEKCNRSLTSFKKDFKERFSVSPHKWITQQRLMHSRLLLISTDNPIADIGTECGFPNTSHFIKLFKKDYTVTPSAYRRSHKQKEEVFNIE